jgi:hypothetical protein
MNGGENERIGRLEARVDELERDAGVNPITPDVGELTRANVKESIESRMLTDGALPWAALDAVAAEIADRHAEAIRGLATEASTAGARAATSATKLRARDEEVDALTEALTQSGVRVAELEAATAFQGRVDRVEEADRSRVALDEVGRILGAAGLGDSLSEMWGYVRSAKATALAAIEGRVHRHSTFGVEPPTRDELGWRLARRDEEVERLLRMNRETCAKSRAERDRRAELEREIEVRDRALRDAVEHAADLCDAEDVDPEVHRLLRLARERVAADEPTPFPSVANEAARWIRFRTSNPAPPATLSRSPGELLDRVVDALGNSGTREEALVELAAALSSAHAEGYDDAGDRSREVLADAVATIAERDHQVEDLLTMNDGSAAEVTRLRAVAARATDAAPDVPAAKALIGRLPAQELGEASWVTACERLAVDPLLRLVLELALDGAGDDLRRELADAGRREDSLRAELATRLADLASERARSATILAERDATRPRPDAVAAENLGIAATCRRLEGERRDLRFELAVVNRALLAACVELEDLDQNAACDADETRGIASAAERLVEFLDAARVEGVEATDVGDVGEPEQFPHVAEERDRLRRAAGDALRLLDDATSSMQSSHKRANVEAAACVLRTALPPLQTATPAA